MAKLPTVAPVLGGTGAPIGMFVITGIGWNVALLKLESNVPTAMGPSTLTPFLMKSTLPVGCVHIEPWKLSALFTNVIAGFALVSVASVSIDRLLVVPCQLLQSQSLVLLLKTAQIFVLLPLTVIVPATSMTAVPV